MKNAVPSAARITAIGKYLVALAASPAASGGPVEDAGPSSHEKTSARRKQLHILYLLNDLLHHTKYHTESLATYSTLTSNLQPHLVSLFGHASAYDSSKFVRHHRKLNELLDIWDQKGYYQTDYIEKLRETQANAARLGHNRGDDEPREQINTTEDIVGGAKKDAPFIMPASHGDSSTPYYDLPAGNMMPHIVPNSSAPINPKLVKPLQFVAGPADKKLAAAMKDFMEDVVSVYATGVNEGGDITMNIDELGQPAIRDEVTGEFIGGENYYGWSRAFCEKMKGRRDGKGPLNQGSRRIRSADRSASPRKRRLYSDWESSRSRSRSPMRSRSRSIGQDVHTRQRVRRRSYSSSRSSSRSRQGFQRSEERSGSRGRATSSRRSRTRSYSPDRGQPAFAPDTQPSFISRAQVSSPAPPPISNSFGGIPLGPNGLPIPPPPPPNYKGPWPPPPPPPPPQMQTAQYPPFSALNPPPPPPFPPPPTDQHASGAFQHGYAPVGQQNRYPGVAGGWSQQRSNISKDAYGARGAPYSGRGHRGGWN